MKHSEVTVANCMSTSDRLVVEHIFIIQFERYILVCNYVQAMYIRVGISLFQNDIHARSI